MKSNWKKVFTIVIIFLLELLINTNSVQASKKNNYDIISSSSNYSKVRSIIINNKDNITYSIKKIGYIKAKVTNKTAKQISTIVGKKDISSSSNINICSMYKRELPLSENFHFNFWPIQWDMKKVTENGEDYKYLPSSSKVTIGLADSGIDLTHPALKNSIVKKGSVNLVPKGGKDGTEPDEKGKANDINDKLGHGTEVAGQLCSTQNIRGVFPGVKLHIYRVLGQKTSDPTWIMKGIIKSADNNDSVINISLGTYVLINNNKQNKIIYKAWKRAISYAYRKGCIIVASVGEDSINENNPLDMLNIYKKINNIMHPEGTVKDTPALLKNVVSVGSSSPNDTVSNFSNYGQKVSFFAPGGDTSLYYQYGPEKWQQLDLTDQNLIATIALNNSYTYAYGTSFAAPKVSAILAAYIAKHNCYNQPHKVINFVKRKTNKNKNGLRIISAKVLKYTN